MWVLIGNIIRQSSWIRSGDYFNNIILISLVAYKKIDSTIYAWNT